MLTPLKTLARNYHRGEKPHVERILLGRLTHDLTLIAARLRQMADRIEALPLAAKTFEMTAGFVPQFVVNAFVDLKFVEAFGYTDRLERP